MLERLDERHLLFPCLFNSIPISWKESTMTDTSPAPSEQEERLSTSPVLHPLEPLSPEEIATAVSIVRVERKLSELVRFVSVTLHEPPPEVALNFKPTDPLRLEAFMVLLDKTDGEGATYEAIVNIKEGRVTSWLHVEGAQPSIMLEPLGRERSRNTVNCLRQGCTRRIINTFSASGLIR